MPTLLMRFLRSLPLNEGSHSRRFDLTPTRSKHCDKKVLRLKPSTRCLNIRESRPAQPVSGASARKSWENHRSIRFVDAAPAERPRHGHPWQKPQNKLTQLNCRPLKVP